MDCIEFNDRLRYWDVASDVAFLAMDLDFRGYRRFADELVSQYLASSGGDETFTAVLNFYRVYRAYVRGKVDSLQLDEPEIGLAQRDEAASRARRYFDLAATVASRPAQRLLVVMCGLSGTGKSFVAGALAGRLGCALTSTDAIRHDAEQALGPAGYGEAGYTERDRDRVYESLCARADEHLAAGVGVVLDGTFMDRRHRDLARRVAERSQSPAFFVEITADDRTVRERLAARDASGSVSDARWDTYVEQRARFDPLDDVPPSSMIRLDTSAQPLDVLIQRAIAEIDRAVRQ
jgi:predicted kinase